MDGSKRYADSSSRFRARANHRAFALFSATISGQPIPQGRPRVARGRVYYSKTLTDYRKEVTYLLEKLYHEGKDHPGNPPLAGPLCVSMRFTGARKGSDLDNLCKGVLDCIVDAGIIWDDDQYTVSRLILEVAEGEPRVEIEIWEM